MESHPKLRLLLPCVLCLGGVCHPGILRGAWSFDGPFGGAAELVRYLPAGANGAVAATRHGQVFFSRDGGESWDLAAFPAPFSGTLHCLEVDPRAPGTWYAGMEGLEARTAGLYKTTDFGRTWTHLAGLRGRAIWSLALASAPGLLAAGADDGVYRSDDAGATWRRISPAANRELRPVVSLAFHPTDPRMLYAGTTHLAWRTTDGGAHWESIHSGMLDDSDVFSIQVNPRRPEIVLASACSGAYRSVNGGRSWTRMRTPPGTFRTYFVAFDPTLDDGILAGTARGLLHSSDAGLSWSTVTRDVVKSIAFDPARPGTMLAAAHTGLWMSSGVGKAARSVKHGFGARNFTAIAAADGVIYAAEAAEQGSDLFASADAGQSWELRTAHPVGGRLVLHLAGAGGEIYGATRDTIHRSPDGGRTWHSLSSPPRARLEALAALPGGTLLAGTADGIYRSADAGRSWTECGSLPAGLELDGLALNAEGALAATSRGLFRSTADCASWLPVREGLDSGTVTAVAWHPARAGEAYAAQYGKVLQSLDGGLHWRPIDDTAGGSYPSALLISQPTPDRLVALLPRRGVIHTALPASNQAPTHVSLGKE